MRGSRGWSFIPSSENFRIIKITLQSYRKYALNNLVHGANQNITHSSSLNNILDPRMCIIITLRFAF